MKTLDILVAVLLVIGGLNWGLVGFFSFDLVAGIFGDASAMSRIIYGIVGLCAFYQAIQLRGIQKRWNLATSNS